MFWKNKLLILEKGGFEETDSRYDDEETVKDFSDEENLEIESNTRKVNQEPIDSIYKEDVVDVNNIDEDKNNDFLEKDNQKKTPDWDTLDKEYCNIEVGVMVDLDTLYQEYVLNKQ